MPEAFSWGLSQQQQKPGGTQLKSPYDPTAGHPFTGLWSGDGAVGYSRDPEGCDNGLKLSTPKGKKHHNFTYDDALPPYPSTSCGDSPIYPPISPVNVPLAKGHVFDGPGNLVRRPLDWRPDYKPRILSLFKNRTEVGGNVLHTSFHPNLSQLLPCSHQTRSPPPPTLHPKLPTNISESPRNTLRLLIRKLSKTQPTA